MIPLLTPQQMRTADTAASQSVGTIALMLSAGERIAEYITRTTAPARVVAFAGPGNNGGDAFAAFALLPPAFERIIFAAESPDPSDARRDAEDRARAAGVQTFPFPRTQGEAEAALAGASLALDALFGTGARLPVAAQYASAIAALNATGTRILAIDIPTGIDAATGAVVEPAVRADATIALGALKVGLFLMPARACAGEVWLAGIGFDDVLLRRDVHAATLDDGTFLARLPQRALDADKRSAGAPLILAGSEQFPGAAVLCARAAARAGAGYVTVATGAPAAPAIRAHLLEQVVVTLPEGAPGDVADALIEIARHNGSVAIGPGLGLDDSTGEIVRAFVAKLELPFVIDASGLFHLQSISISSRGSAASLRHTPVNSRAFPAKGRSLPARASSDCASSWNEPGSRRC